MFSGYQGVSQNYHAIIVGQVYDVDGEKGIEIYNNIQEDEGGIDVFCSVEDALLSKYSKNGKSQHFFIAHVTARLLTSESYMGGLEVDTEYDIKELNSIEDFIKLKLKIAGIPEVYAGDIVINKKRHSCDIRIVEDADEEGILLVNGIKDKYYAKEEFGDFHREYELLVRKEGRLDSHK